jgi:AcrR family transcriptional regulator
MPVRQNKKAEIRESLRQEIMDAARDFFVAEGYQNVSMRKIASRIGYSPTTIYLYFNDKADLMTQICEQTFATLTKNLTKIAERADDPIEGLRAGMIEYINFGLKHPSHYLLLFCSPEPVEMKVSFEQSNGKLAFETLLNSVSKCVEADILRDSDVALNSQVLWAGIHGVTSLLITQTGFPFVGRKKLIAAMVDSLISGISR